MGAVKPRKQKMVLRRKCTSPCVALTCTMPTFRRRNTHINFNYRWFIIMIRVVVGWAIFCSNALKGQFEIWVFAQNYSICVRKGAFAHWWMFPMAMDCHTAHCLFGLSTILFVSACYNRGKLYYAIKENLLMLANKPKFCVIVCCSLTINAVENCSCRSRASNTRTRFQIDLVQWHSNSNTAQLQQLLSVILGHFWYLKWNE